ncbi:MAG: DUF58 domain-containing protein [Pseudomonadota bacterium]|nr:DUF58 domain-containing protein [Pseudomonadota bacterium]
MSGAVVSLQDLVRLRARALGLELGARHLALSAQSGGYASIYRGRGLEFDEVRAYQTGDDARSIDWRVTARRGKPHTKLFREERERPVVLLVDLHPGMFFGSRVRFKSVLAAITAALIAWSAQRAGDRVGGIVSGPDAMRMLEPRARRAGVLALLNALVQCQPVAAGEATPDRLDGSLARLARLVHPGSLVFVLSDFRGLGRAGESSLAAVSRHNDVMLGFTQDPLEAEPPPPGRYGLGTPGRQVVLDTGVPAIAARWREEFARRQDQVTGLCARYGMHPVPLLTHEDPLISLRRGLVRHARTK